MTWVGGRGKKRQIESVIVSSAFIPSLGRTKEISPVTEEILQRNDAVIGLLRCN